MKCWIDLFTGTTWDEFRKAGANVSGFRHGMRKTVSKIEPGDILLCYMTGVMRWVGALEVIGPSDDTRDIWGFDFPCRLAVRPLVMLDPEHGVPMDQLEGRVDFHRGPEDRSKFRGFIRGSPRVFKRAEDGELILSLLREAEKSPVTRPVDPGKLAKKPFFSVKRKRGKKTAETVVSVPERDEAEEEGVVVEAAKPVGAAVTEHVELQRRLIQLGAEMGFDVWVARNDRGRACGEGALAELPRVLDDLPTQFNEATNKTIEQIDVLWLRGNSIVAAFEIECTTSIYSGLLRMSDLLALQPNLNIKLYIVAAEERQAKVEQEILRPTFKLRQKPVAEICGFIAISELVAKVDGARSLGLLSSLKPEFLEQIAIYFTGEDE